MSTSYRKSGEYLREKKKEEEKERSDIISIETIGKGGELN
jgi:hypothetical protein